MTIDPATDDDFDPHSATLLRAEDLFLPSVEAIVKHIARVVAERDYQHYISTGETLYIGLTPKEGNHD